MTEWLYREGEICKTAVFSIRGETARTVYTPRCGRCGGAGGSDKWTHTGWKCYDCGGSGEGNPRAISVYTAAKLEKLNAARSKARAKKAAVLAAKAKAQRDAARAERKGLFAANEKLARRAWALRSDRFIGSILRQAIGRKPLSLAQIDALDCACDNAEAWRAKKAAEEARRNAAHHIGRIGERMTAEVTVLNKISGGQKYVGYGVWTLTILRTTDGNTLTTFGICDLSKGDTAIIKFTVKAHSNSKKTEEPGTQISRLKIIKFIAAAEEAA